MPDGSLRISTKIDNSKIDKDIVELENKIKKLQRNNSKKSLEQNNLENEINKYDELCIKAEEYGQKIKELNLQKKAIFKSNPELAVSVDTPEYASVKNQIAEMKRKYEETTQEIDKQAPKIEKVRLKLQDVKEQQVENNNKIAEYNRKLQESQKKQIDLNYSTEGISKSLNKGITKILRYGMALFSIRSIYGLLSNAMNSWLSGSSDGAKQLRSDIDYMKNAIGGALSPILKYIVDLLYQALGFTGALIKVFTGIDIFAGSVADYMSSTTSSANATNKALKKQLTSFDKINKLNDNSSNGAGGGSGVSLPSQDLSKIMQNYIDSAEKIKDMFESIKDFAIATGLAIAGWKIGDLLGLTGKQKLGLAISLTSIYFYIDGIAGIIKGELNAENFMKAFASSAGLGIGAGMLTGNWKLALILTIGAISLTGGLSIGEWIKQNFPDSIDWYIKEFNLNWDEENLWGKIWKTAGVILGTIGDVIRYGMQQIFGQEFGDEFLWNIVNSIPILNIIVNIADIFINGMDSHLLKPIKQYLFDNFKEIILGVADVVENIPVIGEGIATAIRSGVEASKNDVTKTIEDTTTSSIETAKLKINREATEAGGETGISWMTEMKNKINSDRNNLENTIKTTVTDASNSVKPVAQNKGKEIGVKEIEGIKQGETSQTSSLTNTTSNVVKNANRLLSTFKSAMGIHSPSREMASLAKFIPLGIAEGIDSTSDKAIGSMKSLVSDIEDTASNMNVEYNIPKISKNAVSYIPSQSISTNEIQRSIIGNDDILSKILNNTDGNKDYTFNLNIDLDGEIIRKIIKKKDAEELFATNGGF